jgi:GT2 family glycosyltransferase
MCLGGNVQAGKSQKPWGGSFDYDYMLWIDSDIVFKPQDFIKLLQMEKDIASGLYLMTNGSREPNQFATVVDWDEKFFEKNGYFKFVQREDVVGKTEPFVADYTGFGFILIKKGVFESLDYPWFQPIFFNIGNAHDFCMEDVGFCLKAKEKGHKVWIHPQVIVKHEKKILLST